ncbi:MAG TPA: hypothetical protein VKT25_09835, partial [Ktedonobacteraceae bacterium]|nr:hypothetical protein [Ktedonobacteraceae bacterium]
MKLIAAELLDKRLFGLLPLLPLTKDGARREIVDDLRWLKWRFSMLSDFLRDSPIYQEVLEEARKMLLSLA